MFSVSFISFIVVSQHRVQVSCTSSNTSQTPLVQLMLHNIKLLSSFTNSFTSKAVPHMLSSVLTDAMQRLPSAVNSHIESNKYQYMFEEKPLYNIHAVFRENWSNSMLEPPPRPQFKGWRSLWEILDPPV